VITIKMGILSKDLDKTAQHFVREAIYGILAYLTGIYKKTASNETVSDI